MLVCNCPHSNTPLQSGGSDQFSTFLCLQPEHPYCECTYIEKVPHAEHGFPLCLWQTPECAIPQTCAVLTGFCVQTCDIIALQAAFVTVFVASMNRSWLLQARCEASEAEVQHLQQRLHAASADRTAELEHVQQLNRSLKAEIAAMQNSMSGMSSPHDRRSSGTEIDAASDISGGQTLESFGSCVLIEPDSALAQSLPQLGNGVGHMFPYPAAHRLAPIPEGDGSVSNHTSMHGDEGMQDMHLVPELQNQVRALANSLQDKTQEAEALHQIVEQYKAEVSNMRLAFCVYVI